MEVKTKIGVTSLVAMNLSSVVIGSAIAAIVRTFPGLPTSSVQLLATLPGLGSLIVTLIVGPLSMKMSKKMLSLIGMTLITLGGFAPAI
ncbi:MFS transporter [Streptococcus ovuberis]|uniref:MFS transporter n=1 Tax=Streptococcus ovuberis TaxID=1936207 RepID=A0A7X6N0P2_9STRE|nr:MFS transporter [Streptococcus ovuberis]NKZ19914.1 MFS transporter [Streptococcus ovuberis]